MKIGFQGLGKLGLPVAYTFASKGHAVWGYDISPEPYEQIKNRTYPHQEEGLVELMQNHEVLPALTLEKLVTEADMIFVPIQTPHDPKYEGTTRLPEERIDFDYEHLINGIKDLAGVCHRLKKHIDVAIISTVLPGTTKRLINPLLNEYTHLVYEPMFIAMGTVVQDVLNPEFVLCGVDEEDVADRLEEFYETIHDKPVFRTDINTAEGIKVFYNTFISTKIALANLYGEMSQKVDMNVDDIYEAFSLATDRLISMKYLRAGVGDGGGCHPRDNIALSHIAQKHNLSFDLFEAIMLAREKHMEFIADLALEYGKEITVLGKAFKPETEIETGSPSILLVNILREKGAEVQHVNDIDINERLDPVIIIGTQNQRYKELHLPENSVVIDPFGMIDDQSGVEVIRIGRK